MAPLDDATRKLRWAPSFAECAADGTLGFTHGRWTLVDAANGDEVLARGKYLTVWSRDADGRWLALADIGHQEPDEVPPTT